MRTRKEIADILRQFEGSAETLLKPDWMSWLPFRSALDSDMPSKEKYLLTLMLSQQTMHTELLLDIRDLLSKPTT